jgi:CRISPR-associated protein (Cas_Cmr5)
MASDPQRAAVQEAIAEAARSPFARVHFVAVAKSLPRVLHRHGLGQTLTYIAMRVSSSRGPSPYSVIGRHLDRWLLATTDVSGRTALAALATRDTRSYREATAQAWLFLRALRAALEEGS